MSDSPQRLLGRSSRADRNTRQTIAAWPRLLDLHLAAAYLSVGKRTVEDWLAFGILQTVKMPGGTIRDKNGKIIPGSGDRKIVKNLIDRNDLDALIDARKARES